MNHQFCGMGCVTPIERAYRKNLRYHHRDVVLHTGSIHIPDEVMEKVSSETLYRSVHRHTVARVAHDGIVYVFRVVCGADYIGEVVRTESGAVRVHVWTAVEYHGREVVDICG